MELKRFKTVIDNKHKLGGSPYVLGRINGIMFAMCNGLDGAVFEIDHDDDIDIEILTAECTKRQYDAFSEVIESLYPGLCVFNYVE